jgi:hypothetical protein
MMSDYLLPFFLQSYVKAKAKTKFGFGKSRGIEGIVFV